MNIANASQYSNLIYSAIVVNSDTDMDPEGKGRVQIYIPTIHYDYADIYESYMNSSNKQNSGDFSKFPWAITLVKDLTEKNVVYGSYIDNKNDSFIILGLDVNNPANIIGQGGMGSINGVDVLSLAMPIIISNEVGISADAWPDNISDSYFTKINPADNGGWSIGLIQWHEARAYDCCYYIASNYAEWKKEFTDKNLDLYNSLVNSINKGSATQERTKFGSSFHPTPGTALYQSIENLLGSQSGKSLQIEYAKEDTNSALQILQSNPYNIKSPPLLIYLLDIMNQYGNGISSKSKAAQIAASGKTYMEQLEEFRTYWKTASGNMYTSRRDKTYAYIVELEKQGKFNVDNLVDIADTGSGGEYCIPFVGKFMITAGYGRYPSGSLHSGVDFACPGGTTLVACTNATVYAAGPSGSGYGTYVRLTGDDGNTIIYGHMQKVIVSKGEHVTKGQVIGYSDNTGNSSGNHLHFEIRPKSGGTGQYGSVNPLPYIGVNGYGIGQGVGVYIGS